MPVIARGSAVDRTGLPPAGWQAKMAGSWGAPLVFRSLNALPHLVAWNPLARQALEDRRDRLFQVRGGKVVTLGKLAVTAGEVRPVTGRSVAKGSPGPDQDVEASQVIGELRAAQVHADGCRPVLGRIDLQHTPGAPLVDTVDRETRGEKHVPDPP